MKLLFDNLTVSALALRIGCVCTALLALWIVCRCARSMLSLRYEPETWAYLYLPGEVMLPIHHWECLIGRARHADCRILEPGIQKLHACLIRFPGGGWNVFSLGGGAVRVNNRPVGPTGLRMEDADVLTVGDMAIRFVDLTEEERRSLLRYRHRPGRRFRPFGHFFLLTLLELSLCLQQISSHGEEELLPILAAFGALAALQWVYFFILRAAGTTGFEVETLGFFLCALGISVVCSSDTDGLMKQMVLIGAGVLCFLTLGLWMRDIRRIKILRWPVGLAALALLGANLLFGEARYGAQNWINLGLFTIQPSEFVKVAYIFAGAATLDRLFVNRNLFLFIGYSAACVGVLALMGDFGTALIFFVTFLIISFMRSGSFATVFLAVSGAALGCLLVLTVKPYIAARFATWGHAWEDVYDSGYQQVRAMSAAASGGLFGQGAGRGWFIDVFAADTDLVFAVLSEENGLIVALCAVAALLVLCGFAVRNADADRSSYQIIAGCGAASMMLVQMSLNIFGTMDILPLTGVTFPFVSTGGSSLLSCWMLLAFIKSCDTRAGASFAVIRPDRFTGGIGVPEEQELLRRSFRHEFEPQPTEAQGVNHEDR